MSDSTSDTPKVDPTPDAGKPADAKADVKPAAKPTRTRGQKWRRRIIVALSTIIICAFAIRALVPLLLPTVMRKVASSYGLTVDYDRLDFSMLGGDVGLWNLRFTPTEGGEPILKIGYCRGSVETLGLLQGRLDVDRAEAENAEVTVERLADGTIPLITRFLPPSPADAATNSNAATQPTNIPLEPPLTVKALRLQQARAKLVDRAVSPTTELHLVLNLILSDIGSADLPTRFSIQLNSPEVLGALYVDGSATARNNLVNADLDVRMIGLNLHPLRSYLAAFGVTPTAADLSAQAKGRLTMTPAGGAAVQPGQPITAVAVKLDLHDINLTTDSLHAAAVRKVTVDVPTAAPGEVRVKDILVDGVRAYAWRDGQGRPGFAGIALGADATPVVKKDTAADSAVPATRPAVGQVSALPIIELKSLLVRDVKLEFNDYALPESPSVGLDVQQIALAKVSTDPAHADIPAILDVRASSKGLARSIFVRGDISAAKAVKVVDLKAAIEGIDGSAIDPYIKPFGLARAISNGTLVARVVSTVEPKPDGSLVAGVKLSDVRLSDDGNEWFAFPKVDVTDVAITPDAKRIRFGNIDVKGPALGVSRSSDGAITALGFTFDPRYVKPAAGAQEAVSSPQQAAAAPATQPAGGGLALPVVEIGKLTWSDFGFNVYDALSVPAVSFSLVEVKVEIADLTLDPTATDVKPGTIHASVVSPKNVDRLEINGTVAPTGEAIAFQIAGDASGMTLAGLRPILNTFGLDPVMQAGKLKFTAGGDGRKRDKAIVANLWLKDTSLSDASGDWLSLTGLQVANASFDGSTAGVEKLVVDKPALRVERDEEGKLLAAGLRVIPPTNAPPPPPVDPTAPPIPSRVELALPLVVKLNDLAVNDARVRFTDRAVSPAAKIEPNVTVSLKNIIAGQEADPATLSATVSIPGIIDKLTANGSIRTSPTRQGVQLTVAGQGITGAALQPYLPPGITPSSKAGTLAATFDAQLSHHPEGGSVVTVEAKDVAFADGLRDDPAIKLTAAKFLVDRFDLPGKVIAVKEISTSGFVARVFEGDQGIVLPGVIVGQALADAAPAKPAAPAEIALAGEAADIDKLREAARIRSPLVTLEKLNVGAERLSVQLKSMAYPLAVTNLSLAGENIEMLGDNPNRRPAFDLTVSGGVEKLVDSLQASATLAPFASQPRAKVAVNVTGIHGNEIITLLPELATHIDGQGLSDGKFTTEAEAQFSFVRRGLFGIDPTRDISANFTIKNVALSQAGVEKPLAGVAEVRGENVRIAPLTGNINVKSLDIVRPAAHIVRDAEGISALGMLIKLPANPEPATQPSETAPENPEEKPVQPQQAEPEKPAIDNRADIAIGTLTVSGVDLVLEDRVGTPVTVLPLSDLDVEVKGINTRALREPLPIKFNVLASGGKAPFTREDGSLTEPRELFAQFNASGQVVAYPEPSGYLKSSLSAFDLRSVKGIASQLGIGIGNGTFDFATDVRMQGTDTGVLKFYPTFNDLRVKDSPDGKIQRFMALPMSLDGAIVLVVDADGAISLPVTVPIDAGKFNIGAITGSVLGAVTNQIAQAGIAAPLKVAALAGLNFAQEKDLSPVVVPFSPGESLLTSQQDEQIKQMIERLRKDPTLEIALIHSLGSGDYVLSQQRANPSREDAEGLGRQLRQRKFDLQKQRVELAATLRVALASQSKTLADQALERLQSVSSELMDTEESLDDMLGLLRPGAARQADRRSKAAAIELGQYRLATIQERFLRSNVKDIAKRVTAGRPTASLDNAPELGQVEIKFARRAKQ